MGPRHDLSFCAMQNSVISTRITCLYGSQPSSVVLCFQNSDLMTTIAYKSLWVPDLRLWILWMQNSVLSIKNIQVCMGPSPHLWICSIQNIDFRTRIASLYVSQISPAVLWLQCSVVSTRTTCLYVSQPLSVICECKTAPSRTWMTTLYGIPALHLWFCPCKTAWFAPEWQDYIATSHHLWFCACKTAPLGLELQVSVGQRPHLCFFMQNSDFMTRLTSVLGFQPSSVVFACKTTTFGPE